MHFKSRVFSNTTSLMTSVCMLHVMFSEHLISKIHLCEVLQTVEEYTNNNNNSRRNGG